MEIQAVHSQPLQREVKKDEAKDEVVQNKQVQNEGREEAAREIVKGEPISPKPRFDRYEKGEPEASLGTYEPEKPEDADAPQSSEKPEKSEGPEKSDGKKMTKGTVNTDKVDAEIKKLKEEKQQLEQQIANAAGDEEKTQELRNRLQQVASELSAKDNDAYRKQHASYTFSKV